MSYKQPPTFLNFGFVLVAPPFTTIAVAAPGANKRLRIAAMDIMISSAGTGILDGAYVDGVGGANVWVVYGLSAPANAAGSGHGDNWRHITIPEPGQLLSTNTALVFRGDALTVVAGLIIGNIWFYTDDVT